MSNKLDVDSLRVLTSVVNHRRVGLAASHLNLTQSAVSHTLKRLENRVGFKLLKRESDGFALTREATSFHDYASRLVSLHDEMLSNYRISSLRGNLVLGATEDATHGSLARVLGQFRRTHPDVNLQIKIAQSLVLSDWLKSNRVDMAILQVFEDQVRKTDTLLWRDRLNWVQSADFPLPVDNTIPFVSFSEDCYYRKAASKALRKQGRKLNVVFECPSAKGVNEAVRQGIGVALITESVVDETLVPVKADLPELSEIVHVVRTGVGRKNELVEDLHAILIEELAVDA